MRNPIPEPLDHRAAQALAALEADDPRTLWRLVPGTWIPTSHLQAKHVPADPAWGHGRLAEAFALSFDGYAWGDAQPEPVDPRLLAAQVEHGEEIGTWTADTLRAALFGLQRQYRDSYTPPEPAHVLRLLEALRRLLTESRRVPRRTKRS